MMQTSDTRPSDLGPVLQPPPEEVAPSDDRSIAELLAGYAGILAELRRRGVVRTNNAPVGDYAEWLAARALGGEIVANASEKSYDLRLPRRGPGTGQVESGG